MCLLLPRPLRHCRVERPDRALAARQCAALVAVHAGEGGNLVGQDAGELVDALRPHQDGVAYLGRQRDAASLELADLAEEPDPGVQALEGTPARIGIGPPDQCVTRAAHAAQIDLRFRDPARQAQAFAGGRVCAADASRDDGRRRRARPADVLRQCFDLGRCGRVA